MCLTVPLPTCPPQSGQAYYINDGESVNIFEWMAPLVGARTPPPSQVRIQGSPCLLSLSPFPKKSEDFTLKTSSGNSVY